MNEQNQSEITSLQLAVVIHDEHNLQSAAFNNNNTRWTGEKTPNIFDILILVDIFY